jgi:non-ribosomal peptide synthetase component F
MGYSKLPPKQEAIRASCFHPTETFELFPEDETEESIPQRFEQIVRKHPDRIAVKTADCTLSYSHLNETANRIAGKILSKQGAGEEPVVLLFEHGVQEIAAILGVLKAGKFYVPLNPSFPQARIASILNDSESRLVVTNQQNLPLINEMMGGRVQPLDTDAINANVSDENPGLSVLPVASACIMYTSGSTGEPKGVLQNHRGILHKVMVYTNLLHIGPSDRLTLLHYCSFDSCMHHLFGCLFKRGITFSL